MATTIDTRIRPEIRSVLGSLKNRIRWYVIADGLMVVLFIASVLFWVGYLINQAWFDYSYFELARWFRIGFDVVALGVLAASLAYWIGLGLFRSITTKPLALVLERRFPSLNDRLITSVEAVDAFTGNEPELTRSMLSRTIEHASQEARRLRVSDVFETRPLICSSLAAVVGVASVLLFAVLAPAQFRPFVDAYIFQKDVYWPRQTKLVVQVLVDDTNRWRNLGGNRLRDFDEKQHYQHPRGAPLTLLIHVPHKTPAESQTGRQKPADSVGSPENRNDDYVVPEKVTVRYRYQDEDTFDTVECQPVPQRGERYFKCTFTNLREGIVFFVEGNDYRNRKPYMIDLVDPPRIEGIVLDCEYPPYTWLNSDPSVAQRRDVRGTEEILPLETRFLLEVSTNSPLQYARLKYSTGKAEYVIEFGYADSVQPGGQAKSSLPAGKRPFEARFTWTGLSEVQKISSGAALGIAGVPAVADRLEKKKHRFSQILPPEAARGFFRNGKQPGLRLPFILSRQASPAALARFFQPYEDLQNLFPGLEQPFLLPPECEMTIYLEDVRGIHGADPGKLTLHAEPDKPPVIEAEPREIGTSITRTATIPVFARIADDYGISLVRIEYRVAPFPKKTTVGQPWQFTEETVFRPRDPQTGRFLREYRFQTEQSDTDEEGKEITRQLPYHFLNVANIQVYDPRANDGAGEFRDLKSGDRLTVRIYVEDSDDLNGPNRAVSVQEFDFEIVSETELLDILYNKESNARVRFEAIIKEVTQTQTELQDRRADIARYKQLRAQKPAPGEEKQHQQQLAELERRLRDGATIALAQFRKNHNETQDIEAQFRQIRSELIYNHLRNKDAANVTRIDRYILKNLHEANRRDGNYDQLDRAVDRFGQSVEEKPISPDETDASLAASLRQTELLLERLHLALKEMKELVKFHKAVQDLAKIIKNQELLLKLTRALLLKQFGNPQP